MAEKAVSDNYGLSAGTDTHIKITLVDGTPYGELAHVSGTSLEPELTIDVSDFAPGTGEDGTNILGKLYNDRIIAHEITHAVMDSALGAKMNTIPTWFAEGTAEFIGGADERLKNIIGNAGSTGIDAARSASLISRASDLLGGAAWTGDDMDYSAGYIITKYMSSNLDSSNNMVSLMSAIQSDGSAKGTTALNNALLLDGSGNSIGSIADLKTDFDKGAKASNFITALSLDWGSNEADVGVISGIDANGGAQTAESVINEALAAYKADGQPMQNFNVIFPSEDSMSSSKLIMQVGANYGQTMSIGLQDMRAAVIGLSSVDVSSSSESNLVVKKCDNAIKSVSSVRAKLGAYTNRLEHTIANLGTSSENLTSAESRIKDVDMAKEMSTFSKNNIINQAAQANQQPQQALALLR
ncbi:flagellinolysin [Clostridium sp.]|jgi:flagellin|uniref:flagellinolysin n=1 Tax=Clostridium sp. TaxID=1506 RepID=UPI003EECE43E